MPRPVWIFLTVILLPSIALAWLAVRSVRDQQIILEHQQGVIMQGITDTLARQVSEEAGSLRDEFIKTVEEMLEQHPAPEIALDFDTVLRGAWPPADVGFALSPSGEILSPKAGDSTAAASLLAENGRFLSNRENAEVYVKPAGSENYQQYQTRSFQSNISRERNVAPAQNQQYLQYNSIVPVPEEQSFRSLTKDESSGVLARFIDNRLRLILWYRSSQPSYVFGAQLRRTALPERLRPMVKSTAEFFKQSTLPNGSEWCLALLDDTGRPVALSQPGFKADWKHPFVATEVGDILPHWEAALYLTDPGALGESVRTLQITLGLVVLLLLIAIAVGGFFVALDIRRRTRLAQQKTDFVSNISHELKTPLTSIRMFADLLAEDRVKEPERRASYLRIISAESSRLSRLINNVLDFARMDRGFRNTQKYPCDLREIAIEVAASLRPHLDSLDIPLTIEVPETPLPITGDRDAIAQVLVNLLSNAEKYGGGEIHLKLTHDASTASFEVLDRGPGVPARAAESIFEPFHRLEDSLSSGVPGSGLGLALAKQNAVAHGGDIRYFPRDGGGSRFVFTLPINS